MPIHQDKRTGRWRYEFDARIHGTRHRQRRLLPPGWTRAQAEAFDRQESAALYAIASGIAKPRTHIDTAVGRYLAEHAPTLKHAANLERELHTMTAWTAGRYIDQLPKVCQEYAADQLGALSPATIRNRIAYLRAACRWAWRRHGMADTDPGARVEVPRADNARQITVTRQQMIALARACPHPGVRALIRVAYYTGMRVGEIARAQRITLPGGALAFALSTTKNGEPRIIPAHPRIRTAAAIPIPARSKIDYWWPLARQAAGLPHVHLHDLRHSAASAMVSAGISLATVGAVLGHKSAASTKRYSHWSTDSLAQAVGMIGKRKA